MFERFRVFLQVFTGFCDLTGIAVLGKRADTDAENIFFPFYLIRNAFDDLDPVPLPRSGFDLRDLKFINIGEIIDDRGSVKSAVRPFRYFAEILELFEKIGIGKDAVDIKFISDLKISLCPKVRFVNKIRVRDTFLPGNPLNNQRHKRGTVKGFAIDKSIDSFETVHNCSFCVKLLFFRIQTDIE